MNTVGSALLDTSAVVPYLRGDPPLPTLAAEVAGILTPWVVSGELHFGARRVVRPEEALAQGRAWGGLAVRLAVFAHIRPDRLPIGRRMPARPTKTTGPHRVSRVHFKLKAAG